MFRDLQSVLRVCLGAALVAATLTCREATEPALHRASLSLVPVWPPTMLELRPFGLVIDSIRVRVIRPPTDTIRVVTRYFAPDQSQLELDVSVDMRQESETFTVVLELLSGPTVVFNAMQTITVQAGTTAPPAELPLAYVGDKVATLTLAPLDSVVSFGDALPFRVTARDGAGTPVTQFYLAWSTSDPTLPIEATGVFRAPARRAVLLVSVRTPSGVTASAPLTIIPVPNAINKVGGDTQSGLSGALLPLPLRVQVLAADGQGVRGVPVTFQATTGGGSVGTPLVVTDGQGFAQSTATLGSAVVPNQFTASVPGAAAPAVFSANVLNTGATHLVVLSQPTSGIAGVPLTPLTIAAQDVNGVTVPTFTGPVSVAIGANPAGATLSGTTTVTTAQGLAVFNSLVLSAVGTGYTLIASSPGLTGVTTAPFDVLVGVGGAAPPRWF